MQADVGAVLRIRRDAAEALRLLAQALIVIVGQDQIQPFPELLPGDARLVQGIPGSPSVGPDQAAGAQQGTAEVAGHHTADVLHPGAPQDLQHRHARGALGLSVVGIAGGTAVDDIGPDVVAGVPVLLAHGLQMLQGLLLRLTDPDASDETGFFLDEFCLTFRSGNQISVHS